MEVINFGLQNTIFNTILAELRDEHRQADRSRFRHNLIRASELLAVEMSRHLKYESKTITTPLGTLEMPVLSDYPVLVAILRASLPMLDGFLRIFDRSDNAFISAYRKYTDENHFEIKVEYISVPDLENRTWAILDPMIATGKSMSLTYETLRKIAKPDRVFIVGLIASEEGIEYLERHLPNATLIVGAIDSELTAKSYIVPGLGDAGDLCFGTKN